MADAGHIHKLLSAASLPACGVAGVDDADGWPILFFRGAWVVRVAAGTAGAGMPSATGLWAICANMQWQWVVYSGHRSPNLAVHCTLLNRHYCAVLHSTSG